MNVNSNFNKSNLAALSAGVCTIGVWVMAQVWPSHPIPDYIGAAAQGVLTYLLVLWVPNVEDVR